MKGYYIHQNIKLEELPSTLSPTVPDPVAAEDEVVIDVYYAGLNFFDILQVQGKYQNKPPFPYVPGAEFSGIVAKDSPIPKGCPFVPGVTKVFTSAQGAYAEKVKAKWTSCVVVPETLSLKQAAGIYVTYPTSYAALVYRAALQPGETLLVHAAAGGVGLAALQIGKALGATVIATASTQAKLDICTKAGADHVVNYSDPKWQATVKELTKGKGVDVVYDPVGLINPSLKCIAWNGRLIVVGFAGGTIEKIPANLILLKNVAVTGIHWGAYSKNETNKISECWSDLLALLAQGKLNPAVFDKDYKGLESLPKGLDDLGNRRTWGKAVLAVRESSSSL